MNQFTIEDRRFNPGMAKSGPHQHARFLLLISAALTACCGSRSTTSGATSPILLFNGTGTSPNDVAAIETILNTSHLNYSTVNSSQLNAMAEPRISSHRLLIVPGGNFVEMGNGLAASTTANVRNAVKAGMNYLGICAGGFLAGRFPASYNSFNLSSGVQFGFYFPEQDASIPAHVSELYGFRPEVGPHGMKHKAAVRIATPEGKALDQYWEGGPQFTGWGEVAGKYPDGTPAIVEGFVGQGRVILSGVHAEAPESWRRGMVFNTPVSDDAAFARMLILAALNRAKLPHY